MQRATVGRFVPAALLAVSTFSIAGSALAAPAPSPSPAASASSVALAGSSVCADGYWCVWDGSGFTYGKFTKSTNVDNFVWFTFLNTNKSVDNQTEAARNRWSTGRYLELYDGGGYQGALFCLKSGTAQGYLASGQGNRASSAKQVGSKGGCY